MMDFSILFLTLLWSSRGFTAEDGKPSGAPSSGESERWDGAAAVNQFGYNLTLKMIKKNADVNIVISPTGVAGLLAMTLLGSVGSTHDELALALGFSEDILINRQHHELFGESLQRLSSADATSLTLYADAIFVDEHTNIRPAYKDYLRRVYHGDAISVNFTETTKSKDLINSWVNNNTHGKIEDFLPQTLPINTQIVLLSALYFSGQWEHPFITQYTRMMQFATPSKKVMTELMFNAGQFNYIRSREYGLHMVALSYNNSDTAMYVVKPLVPERLPLTDVMARLDHSTIEELISQMRKEDCVITFPKMELKSKVVLEDYLQDLGIRSLFSSEKANFALMIDSNRVENVSENELISRINNGEVETRDVKSQLNGLPNPGVYVDTVLHDVKISINEHGTEAAAAAAGTLARTAHLFYADSPFYMFIRHDTTKLVTFSAAIFDPTA